MSPAAKVKSKMIFTLKHHLEDIDIPQTQASQNLLKHNQITECINQNTLKLTQLQNEYQQRANQSHPKSNYIRSPVSPKSPESSSEYSQEFLTTISEALGFDVNTLETKSNSLTIEQKCQLFKKKNRTRHIFIQKEASQNTQALKVLENEYVDKFNTLFQQAIQEIKSLYEVLMNQNVEWGFIAFFGGMISHSRKNDLLPKNNFHVSHLYYLFNLKALV